MHSFVNARLGWRTCFLKTPISLRWGSKVRIVDMLERAARMLHPGFTDPGVAQKVVRFQTRLA